MNSLRTRRLLLVIFLIGGVSLTVGLILFALSKNVNLFYTPTEIVEGIAPVGQPIRIGGMVVKGSIQRGEALNVCFTVTDYGQTAVVRYNGILPDLFKEGQGVVALGTLDADKRFMASQILAKHDEKYMPPEVKASLRGKM